MSFFRHINRKVYLQIVTAMVCLSGISFFFSIAESDGATGTVITGLVFPAKVLSFPFFWLRSVFKPAAPLWIPVSIGLSILLNAFLAERCIFYTKAIRKNEQHDTR